MPSNASRAVPISHWSTLIEDFQASPLSFYEAVEAALVRRQMPQTKNTRIDYHEAGLTSARREYLRVSREKVIFDICAAPFGNGFFVSYWQAEEEPTLSLPLKILTIVGMSLTLLFSMSYIDLLGGPFLLAVAVLAALSFISALPPGGFDEDIVRALPFIGRLYVRLFRPDTYYRIDTMQMFQKTVHRAVLEVIDSMTSEKGVRTLSDEERKPIMRDFYKGMRG